jgi:hypothetical protein
MKMFPYFDIWDDAAVRECCVLSKIKRYEPDQIILGNNTMTIPHATYVLRSPLFWKLALHPWRLHNHMAPYTRRTDASTTLLQKS